MTFSAKKIVKTMNPISMSKEIKLHAITSMIVALIINPFFGNNK